MLSVEDARKAVRLSTTTFDDELAALIEAGKEDMQSAGIAEMPSDGLYDQAIRMYVKGSFEPGEESAESCREIYRQIKEGMKHMDKYREAEIT